MSRGEVKERALYFRAATDAYFHYPLICILCARSIVSSFKMSENCGEKKSQFPRAQSDDLKLSDQRSRTQRQKSSKSFHRRSWNEQMFCLQNDANDYRNSCHFIFFKSTYQLIDASLPLYCTCHFNWPICKLNVPLH